MTTFARPTLLDARYAVIAETSAFTYDDDDLVNYADFLRKHGRYMTKGGYVDSSRRIRSLHRQQDDLLQSQQQISPSRGGLIGSIQKSSLSSSSAPVTASSRKVNQSDGNELPSIISISTNIENKKKDHDKHMRLIEEQVIKSKKGEIDVKRPEKEIKKEQRHLHYTLKELDSDPNKKRFDLDKYSLTTFEEKNRMEKDHKKKEQQRKLRTDLTIGSLKIHKEQERQNILVCNDLARQYRIKASELEEKHQQLTKLHLEYENKIQQKELEENRLKKEIGDIAMSLNLEAQRAKNESTDYTTITKYSRTQVIKRELEQTKSFEERLNETSIHVKNYDLERRRLSADVSLNRSMIDLKQREALRRIVDTKNQLEVIYTKQRELNQNAAIAEQDRRATELMTKLADVENRRTQLMGEYLREKIEKSEEREAEGSTKAKIRHAEHETQQHEDHLRHFQKAVSKSDEIENDLHRSLKESEYQRQKKEDEIKSLETELMRKKQLDAARIRNEIANAEKVERDLEEQLLLEKSKLDKLHVEREENYSRLLKQREKIRENKILLNTHEREYKRLMRVNVRSKSLQSLSTI